MTATHATTRPFIERPAARRARVKPVPTLRDTPHGEALTDNVRIAALAVDVLLSGRCLIERVRLDADAVHVRLVRAPTPGVLERHATRLWWYRLDTPGEAIRGLLWRGVFVEWPVHEADLPDDTNDSAEIGLEGVGS